MENSIYKYNTKRFLMVWKITLATFSIVALIALAGGVYAFVVIGLIARVRKSYVKARAGEIAEEVIGNVRTVQAFAGEEKICLVSACILPCEEALKLNFSKIPAQAQEVAAHAKQFLLITAFKKSVDLTMLDFLLPVSGNNYDITQLPLQIEAYVTIEKEPPSDDQKLCQLIWFKPSATDVYNLGSNSWLWLGALISSSFLKFLLLIGLLTRYYIYPVDQHEILIQGKISSKHVNHMRLQKCDCNSSFYVEPGLKNAKPKDEVWKQYCLEFLKSVSATCVIAL
ncbi:hypothetical protein RHSIM_Rhsim07G0129300 [Rhododendron simsii]|uniref:ABC transmembrane type-1 domain-containing protein n=1 Tax=Rhododendron simsii TaxID=118357 RepID=A0A834GQC8_RHOSS|nr:hypothetical protein RHSIM_Rhsim07G0129300 [Rhododendron simsii]